MSLVLSQQEIADLTGRMRRSAQLRQLAFMGIPYRERSDGTLVVLRIHAITVEAATPPAPQRRAPRLRFDA